MLDHVFTQRDLDLTPIPLKTTDLDFDKNYPVYTPRAWK
jgi:hypothetical protein